MAYRNDFRRPPRMPMLANLLFLAYLIVVAVVIGLMAALGISPFELPSIPAGFQGLI